MGTVGFEREKSQQRPFLVRAKGGDSLTGEGDLQGTEK
jgi:hypothetical protein